MKLEWSRRALQDIVRLHAFLNRVNPQAANNAVSVIEQKATLLEQFPELGPVDQSPLALEGSRLLYIRFGKGDYVLRYRLYLNGRITITRVWHSREQRH